MNKWSKDLIIENIIERHRNGLSLSMRDVQKEEKGLSIAGRRYFGNWESAVNAAGFNYSDFLQNIKWNKEKVLQEIQKRIDEGLHLNAAEVVKENDKLYNAAKKHLGSWESAIESMGLNYNEIRMQKEVGYWTKEATIEALKERFNQGLALNRNSVLKTDGGLLNACIRHFGTYENAILACGLEYDNVREDISLMSYYGIKFEKVVGDIFKDLSKPHTKGYTNEIIPDFVFSNDHWADAKLSEWTVYGCETIKKYEPYCKSLMIIYLRGDRAKDEMLTQKTRLLSVYKLIQQLPKDEELYYLDILNELYGQANKHEDKKEKPLPIDNTSQYKGVQWRKDSQKWGVAITINNERTHLGLFESEIEAAKAYDNYIIENKLNKPVNFGENPLAKSAFQSKFIGVSWHKKLEKWMSKIQVNKKSSFLGYFLTEVEAAKAYNDYIIENNLDRQLNQITEEELNSIIQEPKPKGIGKSHFIGISWNNRLCKWKCEVTINKSRKFLGYFTDEIEAARARNKFILENNLDLTLNDILDNTSAS